MKMKSKQRPVYRMEGGYPLHGEVVIQGSKNASLPILAATILVGETCKIYNCPVIEDVQCMKKLLSYVGCRIRTKGKEICVDATQIDKYWFQKQQMRAMRSSIILLGAMLGRKKRVQVYQPGGCLLGERPIDLHLYAMKCLGATVEQIGDIIEVHAKHLTGNKIDFPKVSVGATQNAVLAAVLAQGTTQIWNASVEPEVISLCEFLRMAGAKIDGIGEHRLEITGVEKLHEVTYEIPNDRIVAGTYLLGTLGIGGEVVLKKAPVSHMNAVIELVKKMGGEVNVENETIYLLAKNRPCNVEYLETSVYPGFPTDLQSALLATACIGKGRMEIRDSIFEQRFRTIEELNRMGANVCIEHGNAKIQGVDKLTGRNVIAKELRGGASLVAAGLMAEGITTVSDIMYIERGYEDIVRDYKCLGARIEKGC